MMPRPAFVRSVAMVLACLSLHAGCAPRSTLPNGETAQWQRFLKCLNSDQDGASCARFDPSLAELIGRPEWYAGREVRVTGVLSLQFERWALYGSREDYDHEALGNLVPLQLTTDETRLYSSLEGAYVYVDARFEAATPDGRARPRLVSVRRIWANRAVRGVVSTP